MPTALERQGDFSQTFDANGRLINIKDPLSTAACSVTAGGAGASPATVIPANRHRPERAGAAEPDAAAEHDRARTTPTTSRGRRPPTNPRFNNLLRLDGRPSGNNTIWGSVPHVATRTRTARRSPPARRKWGFFDGAVRLLATTRSTAAGTTSSAPTCVNEFSDRRTAAQTEGFGTKTDADLQRIRKSDVGYTLGQFIRS